MTTLAQAPGELMTQRVASQLAALQIDKDTNIAGQDQDNDTRVCKYVQTRVTEFLDRMRSLHDRWRITYYMLMGNTIDRAGPIDVHVPELYKMLETLVPRLEGAILDPDPFFRTKPRTEESQGKADAISAFLDWELDLCAFRGLIQPAIRDALVTQVGVFRAWWDRKVEKRKHKVVETKGKGFDTKKIVRRELRDTVIYDGPRVKLVDPFDFIIDPKATDPQSARYVGDRTWWTFDELKEFERQGYLKNVDALREEPANGTLYDSRMDEYKWSRSPTERYAPAPQQNEKISGQPKLYEVVTMWGQFDLHGNGEYEECVLAVANGRVCVQAMPNPYDFKQRPYATIRAARNGHDFFGTGPLDNAVRLNQYLDRYHSIFLRSAEIAGMPIMFAEEDSDIPDSLFKVRPFQVYKGVGNVRMTSIPDGMLKSAPMVLGLITRNIEETVGAFKIQMGQESTGETATQSMISKDEGNRRNSGLVRGIRDGLNQLLTLMHQFNVQFVNEDVAFRVVGKRAMDLADEYVTVGPDTFMEDVDFEFVGLESLHTYGMKATGLQQIMATAGPLIVQNGDRVDQVGILHELFASLVGREEADRYVRVPDRSDKRMPQEQENYLLARGIKIAISRDDPHPEHIEKMLPLVAYVKTEKNVDPKLYEAVMTHFMGHYYANEKDKERKAVMEREASMKGPAMAPEAGGMPGENGKQSPKAGGMSDAMQTPQGQNPGPRDGQKYGTMGRANQPVAQTEDNL